MRKFRRFLRKSRKNLSLRLSSIRKSSLNIIHKIISFIDQKPLPSFFTLLGLIVTLIILGNFFRKPEIKSQTTAPTVKSVSTYSIGRAPRMKIQAKIEKSGSLKIVPLTAGIVQRVYKKEGTKVRKGDWLFFLSSNYQGGSAASLTRQIAEKNYTFLKDTYDSQKEIIAKNKELAQKAETQASALRDIGSQAIDEARSLISLNEDVVGMIDTQIQSLEAINVLGSSNSAILQLKSSKAGVLAGLNQAKATLRTTEYQTDENNEPAKIAGLQKDVTVKQLDLQEKSLDLNKDVSFLNLRLAQIQESLSYPVSPCSGIIERIYVKQGQSVAPGTSTLASISCDKNSTMVVAATSKTIAQNISQVEFSNIIGDNSLVINLYPTYISQEPTEANLHSIQYTLPAEYEDKFSDGQIIQVEIPIGLPQTLAALPFIPLDAIYQTMDEAYLFVVEKSTDGKLKALSKKVILGEVYGSYVRIKEGLNSGDQVILDRNIIEGDALSVKT